MSNWKRYGESTYIEANGERLEAAFFVKPEHGTRDMRLSLFRDGDDRLFSVDSRILAGGRVPTRAALLQDAHRIVHSGDWVAGSVYPLT